VIRALVSLEGAATMLDPDFQVVSRAYPYILQQVIKDRSPEMREVLRSIILYQDECIRWSRLERMLLPVAQTIGDSPAGMSIGAAILGPSSGDSSESISENMQLLTSAVEDGAQFLFSPTGSRIREALFRDLVRAMDPPRETQERDAVHVKSKQHHHHTKRSHGDLPPSHSRDNIHDEAGTTGSNSQHDGTVFSRAEESEPRTSKGLDYAQMKLMVEVLGRLIASAPQVWLPLVWETVHNPEAQRFAKALVQETLATLGKRTAEEWILQISEVLHHADNAREYLKSR